MNYLIVGGSGFIGTNLVNRLEGNCNNNIRIFDKKTPKNNTLEWFIGDVVYSDLDEVFKKIDVVIHLACQPGVETSVKDPIGTFNQNVFGTLNCLEASRKAGVKRFIFASSGGTVLGKQKEPLKETLTPNPTSPYGASKLACEGYCKAYYHTYGLETVILRFSNVYGPHSEFKSFNLIPGFIMNAIEDNPCFINGDGFVTKDYIFVDDLINVILTSLTLPEIGGEIFQIATGIVKNINEVVDILQDVCFRYLGRGFKVINRASRVGDVSYECDISKARDKLSFKPIYDLNTGLHNTFKWFVDNWRME